jgi:16S rRNA processing protein RimM
VQVAKVTKAQGIKGEVKIYPFSSAPENFSLYRNLVFVDSSQKQVRKIELSHSRVHGNSAVLTLSGITNRNDAEQLIGCEIWIHQDELPELDEDEFYWHDFEGAEVFTVAGEYLGRVTSLMSTGAHDILVISGEGEEYMIPVRDEFLVEFNSDERRISVNPPEGLLDINKKGN